MEKKINKKKQEIVDAQAERARRKVLYDSQMIILEGQRKVVIELEQKADTVQKDYTEAHNRVDTLLKELNGLTEQLSNELDNNNN